MGRRGRARGQVPGALRGRRDRAHAIASRVYSVALDLGEGSAYPLDLQAPVQCAAEMAAVQIVRANGVPPGVSEDEAVADVVTYMLAGFFAIALEYDPAHHERFRALARNGGGYGGADVGGSDGESREGERGPVEEEDSEGRASDG